MDIITQISLIIAFFTALKAIQHKGEPIVYPIMSIMSWIALIVGILLWLVQ